MRGLLSVVVSRVGMAADVELHMGNGDAANGRGGGGGESEGTQSRKP